MDWALDASATETMLHNAFLEAGWITKNSKQVGN